MYNKTSLQEGIFSISTGRVLDWDLYDNRGIDSDILYDFY